MPLGCKFTESDYVCGHKANTKIPWSKWGKKHKKPHKNQSASNLKNSLLNNPRITKCNKSTKYKLYDVNIRIETGLQLNSEEKL